MLLDNQPTPFDLRFRMFAFPVRVNPLFWLSMALLGQASFQAGFEFGLIWVACGFASILFHELGHAVAIRRYGSPARIELFAFGGLTIPTYVPTSPYRRLAIALAGPAAGFLLFGLVYGSNELFGWAVPRRDGEGFRTPYLTAVYADLYFINLAWTLLNLLPVWPFDGGRALREILVIAGHRRPDRTALWVSVATAGFLTVYGLLVNLGRPPRALTDVVPWWATPSPLGTLFFALLAVQSYLLLRQTAPGPRLYTDDDDRLPWERRR